MYTVWCEWDIGIEGKIFANYEVAEKHAVINLEACGIEESFEELDRDGLIGIEGVEVIYV
ncbi:hypothetical protein D3C75_539860 [compost metagenome]